MRATAVSLAISLAVLLVATAAGVLAAAVIAWTGFGLAGELLTLRARLELNQAMGGPAHADARVVLIDAGTSLDAERLADVVELARAHGARAQGLLTVPAFAESEPNERLRAAIAECRCVVVPEHHLLVSVAASRGHVVIDTSGAIARVPFSAGTRPTFALAVARVAGAPAHVDGREEAFVRERPARVLSLDDVLAPRVDLAGTFRGALVLMGPAPALAVHASVLDDLINDRLLEPPPKHFTMALAAALALLAALACSSRRAALARGALAFVLLASWVNAAVALASEVWLPVAAPTVALLVAAVFAHAAGRRA